MIKVDNLLGEISKTRILVVGDVMLDHYLWGDVHRISPEAPVPVVHVASDSYTAGGAANVALNLSNLGVKVSVLGYFGDDDAGTRLTGILTKNGVKIISAGYDNRVPTIIKSRVIVRNQQLCRIDREHARSGYRLDDIPDFATLLSNALEDVDAVIVSDYAKGVVTQRMVDYIMAERDKRPALLVAVDPKPSHQIVYKQAGLLTPNRTEALELAGIGQLPPGEAYPLEQICRNIHEKYDPRLLVITLGAEGMAICGKGEVVKRLPTVAREVFDVSGAGDTVISLLTAALGAGADISKAAWLANGAAGCVVAHVGTAPVNKSELENWVSLQLQGSAAQS